MLLPSPPRRRAGTLAPMPPEGRSMTPMIVTPLLLVASNVLTTDR